MVSISIDTSMELSSITPGDIVLIGASVALAIIDVCTGHAVLRASHLPGYDYPIRRSAAMGAVGGAILALPFLSFLHCFRDHAEHRSASLMSRISVKRELIVLLAIGTATGAASAFMGSLVLGANWPDKTHVVHTGALGGTIIGPGILVIVSMLYVLGTFTFARSQNEQAAQDVVV